MDKELEAYKELVGKEEYHRQYAQLYSEAKQKKTRFSEREYTNNPEKLKQIKEKLKSLCETKGLIVFFSSHVLDVVEKFCNKISIIKKGKIVESGETQVVKGEGSLEDKFMEIFNE